MGQIQHPSRKQVRRRAFPKDDERRGTARRALHLSIHRDGHLDVPFLALPNGLLAIQ
jgi:hypothetical protein